MIALYDKLRGIIEKRYGEAGIDALHNAFISLYQCKAYTRLDAKLPQSKVLAWLIEACKLSVRGHRRTEALHRSRYKLLSELEFMVLSRTAMESVYGSSVAMPWEEIDERPLELIKDVQKAIGALSALTGAPLYALSMAAVQVVLQGKHWFARPAQPVAPWSSKLVAKPVGVQVLAFVAKPEQLPESHFACCKEGI